jgi:hypothetical protein
MMKTPPEKREDKPVAEPSPQPRTPGVAPIDAASFSRRAAEIMAKAVAPSGKKRGGSRKQRRNA